MISILGGLIIGLLIYSCIIRFVIALDRIRTANKYRGKTGFAEKFAFEIDERIRGGGNEWHINQ